MISLDSIKPGTYPVVHHASQWSVGHNNWVVIIIVIVLIAFVVGGLMGPGKH